MFCPPQAEIFLRHLMLQYPEPIKHYLKKNIIFARRRRKNFEVLITAALLSRTSLKLFFKSYLFFQLTTEWDADFEASNFIFAPVSRIRGKLKVQLCARSLA